MSRVAFRYVKSLLGLAIEQNALDRVHQDLQLFAAVCDENRSLVLMLRNPVIKHDKKRAVLNALFGSRIHSLTAAIFDIITRKHREPLLFEIAKEFHLAYNKFMGIERAVVTTAIALDETARNEIKRIVKGIGNMKEVELIEDIDKDIIGGFHLAVQDKQVDATIRSKLKALQLKFTKNPYIKEF